MALGKPEKGDLFVSGSSNTQPQQGIFLTCPACVDIALLSIKIQLLWRQRCEVFSARGHRKAQGAAIHVPWTVKPTLYLANTD